jgi:hypothetical protein
MAESRGLEPHTFRCHRCSKPCRRACPVDSPRWRTAEALIPSAEAPTRFPIEAGGTPVHCPNRGMTAGLHRNASRRPSVFKAAPARLSGSSSRAALSAFAAGTAVSSFPFRGESPAPFGIKIWPPRQDSNLHPRNSEGRARPVERRGDGRRRPKLAAGAATSRAGHPSTENRARSRAESSAGRDAGPPSSRAASARTASAAA